MAIFLLALAAWLSVSGRGWAAEFLLLAAALVMVAADATKYASALWDPVIISLAALAPGRSVQRSVLRGLRLTVYAVALLAAAGRLAGPGSAYVTWVGIDGYYYLADDSFQGVLGPTIADVRRFTGKPILIAETGITSGTVPGAMPGLIAGIRHRHLLGLVWFDANAGLDWRLEGSPAAVAAFRSGIAGMLAQAGEPRSSG
jgi:hypothetical protein